MKNAQATQAKTSLEPASRPNWVVSAFFRRGKDNELPLRCFYGDRLAFCFNAWNYRDGELWLKCCPAWERLTWWAPKQKNCPIRGLSTSFSPNLESMSIYHSFSCLDTWRGSYNNMVESRTLSQIVRKRRKKTKKRSKLREPTLLASSSASEEIGIYYHFRRAESSQIAKKIVQTELKMRQQGILLKPSNDWNTEIEMRPREIY